MRAKIKVTPLILAFFMVFIAVAPLFSVNVFASSSKDKYEGVKIRSGVYKVALLDADFFSSKDGCLSSSEESEILDLMQETADKIRCNIGIAITNDLKGMSHIQYAKDFSDTMFGAYSDSATLLLLNRHDNPAYASYKDRMYFVDRADDLYSDNADGIFNRIYAALDRDPNDFYGACSGFCGALAHYNSPLSSIHIDFGVVFFALIASVVMAIIVTTSFTSGYKKKTPLSAAHYIDKTRTRVTRQVDQFVREHTTSVHISSSSSGGHHGGGGGGHHSSGHSGRGR